MDAASLAAIGLSVKLAAATTAILLLLGTPLAWWLARGRSSGGLGWLRTPVRALIALPLVLPPSVLGFYLLLALGPHGPLGRVTQELGWGTLAFTFWGLLIGSIVYSLPFVVQPIVQAFE
ncbi:MAG: molybdate ABC transporter permease subunit, partial [Burkholderiaceae bacterium]|nr:molybdate ABC transporter permease subunit [Burkholderiaceae bacterium]